MSSIAGLPQDEHNERLIQNVHPPDWQNPTPAERYNLVVIGAGSAGLVSAGGGGGLGGKVALVEKDLMGGDCLNVGCVPSKSLIRSARVMADIRRAGQYGIEPAGEATINFAKVMARVRRVRADISPHDSARRFRDQFGVDVFLGEGRFIDEETVEVAGDRLRFTKAIIATGSRPYIPPINGLAETDYLTNETIFNLTEQPRRLAVIGGGPIGCELAQAFQRLGSRVTLFHNAGHLLNREDADAAEIIQRVFIHEGVRLILNNTVERITANGNEKTLHYRCPEESGQITVDAILVATGRSPNVEDLGLEAAGVQYDRRQGVLVNDRLQTSNSRIYAAGDVCLAHKFTHAADAAARLVLRNALFFGRSKQSTLTIPWCTYTDPEVAHVGLYPAAAEIAIETFKIPLSEVDRAVADGETEGFAKIHLKQGADEIVGATIVARNAGDLINEITLAMVGGLGLGTIANTIHPYPTQAEAIKKAADAYNRTRLTPTVKKLFSAWLSWTR